MRLYIDTSLVYEVDSHQPGCGYFDPSGLLITGGGVGVEIVVTKDFFFLGIFLVLLVIPGGRPLLGGTYITTSKSESVLAGFNLLSNYSTLVP